MKDLCKYTGKIKLSLDIQTENNRGLKIDPPHLNLKIEQYDSEDKIVSTCIIPEDIMQGGIDSMYNKLVENYDEKH